MVGTGLWRYVDGGPGPKHGSVAFLANEVMKEGKQGAVKGECSR